MAKLTAVEWDIINARVGVSVSKHGLRTASLGFLYLVLEQFFPGRVGEWSEIVTDGSNDRGVDAIEIIEREDQAEIFIFQSKYRDGHNTTDKTINESEVLKITSFLNELFDKSENLKSTNNLQLDEAVGRLWSLHERGVICRYRIVLCSNDQGLSRSAAGILRSAINNWPDVSYETYGPTDFLRDLGARGRGNEMGHLQVMGREVFERADGDIRGLVASVDARSFVDLIRSDDGQSVKRHLFDDNLRVFLGENGGYNSAIIETATSLDSHLFWYLNNGITITCKNYAYNKSHVNPKIKIDSFQIVNGAQTSHSLLDAARKNPQCLENVVLTVRVYATERSDITARVAVATNSQARIQSRDLRANNEILKKLEMAFADRGYYFERKRNMHSDRDQKRRIDALKLGQIIMAYYLREPDRARTDSDSIFDGQFFRIFHEHYDVGELCRLYELYQLIEEMKDDYVVHRSGSVESGGDERYLIYGNWFVLFAARLLLSRDGLPIPAKTNAKPLVLEAIGLVARTCSQGKAVAHYQMFRSAKTKDKIMAEFSGGQMSFLDMLAKLDK